MHTNKLLMTLITGILQEINELGLCYEANCQYRRIYDRFKEFAKRRNKDFYTPDLADSFLENIKQRFKTGAIGKARRNHLRRALLLLKDYAETGTFEWKVYVVRSQWMPLATKFVSLYSQYIASLKCHGKSENTIQAARNMIRQFLLFLEDNNCSTLATVPLDLIPAFFQHLLATYKSTSIRTVASHIRTFLDFTDEGDRLIPLVPLRCARNKPIIPILSDNERNALKKVLQSSNISLRDKAIIQLALRTGVRAVDIVGMKLKDIDWINDTISIFQSKTKSPYTIPLTADVGNLLSAYILTERPKTDNPYVFLRSKAPFKSLCDHSVCYALLRKAFRQAGIRLGDERKGLHVIRHTTASQMLSKGVPVTTISSLLGHANKTATNVYLALDKKHLQECALPLINFPMP